MQPLNSSDMVVKRATSTTDLRMGNTPDWQIAIRRPSLLGVTKQAV
jgi:hypothetical protein